MWPAPTGAAPGTGCWSPWHRPLALTATINWDLLAVALTAAGDADVVPQPPAGGRRPIGLATAAKLYPVLLLGPLLVLCWRAGTWRAYGKAAVGAAACLAGGEPAGDDHARCRGFHIREGWTKFYTFSQERPIDFGSVWLLISQRTGNPLENANTYATLLMIVGCGAIGLLALYAPRRPRFAQLAFLVVALFILTNKVYSPQYVLWLIPLAALARPRWRDFLIWQACEVMYFLGIWMYLAYTGSGDKHQGLPLEGYQLAIALHLLGTLYLCAVVVRDILMPERDVVRRDGDDDPSGGVLDRSPDVFVLGRAPSPSPARGALRGGATGALGCRTGMSRPLTRHAKGPVPQRTSAAPGPSCVRAGARPVQRSTMRSNWVVVCRRCATSSSPTCGCGASPGTNRIDTCMCGGSANQRCFPAHTIRREVAVDGGQAGPGHALGARHHAVQCLGRLQADAVRGAAGHHDQVAVGGRLLLAVAEAVALGDPGDVEHRAAVLGGVVVAEPQPRADPRAEPGLRELLLETGEFIGLEVADEHGVQRQPGGAQPVHPADDLLDRVRAVGAVQRQVDGEALEPDVLDGRGQLRQVLRA